MESLLRLGRWRHGVMQRCKIFKEARGRDQPGASPRRLQYEVLVMRQKSVV